MKVVPLVPVHVHALWPGTLVEEGGRLYQIDRLTGDYFSFSLRYRFVVTDVATGRSRTLVRFPETEAANLPERELCYLSRDDTASVLLDLETCEEFRVPLRLGAPAFSRSTPGDTLVSGFWRGRPVTFRRCRYFRSA